MEYSCFTPKYSAFWLLMVCIFVQPWASTSCLEHEMAALLQLKAYFISNVARPYLFKGTYEKLSSWDSTGEGNCCLWHGVMCNNSTRHVTHLHLHGIMTLSPIVMNVSLFEAFGELISLDLSQNCIQRFAGDGGIELGHLKKLKVLDLSFNNISGSLPGEGLCKLRDLTELILYGNSLSGRLPKCLWNMTSLRALDLLDNNFRGRFSLSYLMKNSPLQVLLLSNNALQIHLEDSSSSSTSKLTHLGLSHCNFKGQSKIFLKFLSHQSNLEYLDLSGTGLSGLFPDWLLQNNSNLQYLNLRGNSLMGSVSIPNHSNLSSLSQFDISSNKLNGSIPEHIGLVLSSVQVLNMSSNSFEGHIPASIANISLLIALDLSYNSFYGEVPNRLLSQCNWLNYLSLSNNKLQGEIVPSFMNLSRLWCLILDNNYFDGTIRGSLRISKGLSLFDISNNIVTGGLPHWIGDFESLESMSLARNEFHGDIPSQLCKLKSLDFLDLSENRFTGGIPYCERPLPVRFLHLHGNHLTGVISKGLTRLTSLVTLDLRNNRLSGAIPRWIDKLSQNLVVILLGGNQLEGELPIELCRLQRVNIIDLSNNNLSGVIPSCFQNMSFGAQNEELFYPLSWWIDEDVPLNNHFDLYLEDVEMFEPENREEVEFIEKSIYSSYKGYILSMMSELDLSYNKLVGVIPQELGKLEMIHALNLSHNLLSGSIPETFSNLKSVESLDLSSNNLSGTIPWQLVDLTFLEIFNVSYNNLSGEVPKTAQFGGFGEPNYRGNPLLCGSQLSRSCKKDESVSTGNTSTAAGVEGFNMEVFLWSFGMSSVTIFLAVNAVLAINPYWRRAWFAFVDVKFLWWFIA